MLFWNRPKHALSPDGEVLALANNKGALRFWSTTTGALIKDVPPSEPSR